ncbi:MAG: DUF3455 domain-containing protein [Hydrococcus sp. Prado102]|jgi:hypothetical protein|nr:DUF3455 domain-containing protein [Hydrococcus sp. Prado102]
MKLHFWTRIAAIAFVAFQGAIASFVGFIPNLAIAQTLPDSLKIPEGQHFLFKTSAKGSQIYVCQSQEKGFEWTLKAPDAVLLDEQGEQFGQHYLGPSWEAKDGSKIMGQVKSKADAPQADAIPWLLLEASSHEGDGVFSSVNWIVRLNTVGGKAPLDGCDSANQDREISVDYSADYYFYGASAASNY